MRENVIAVKSKAFAIKIIRLYQYLCTEKKEYVMSKQILRSGTSIAANVAEGTRGQSKADFFAKMNISNKEASETCLWLELLFETGYIEENYYTELHEDCKELIRILMAIIKNQSREK